MELTPFLLFIFLPIFTLLHGKFLLIETDESVNSPTADNPYGGFQNRVKEGTGIVQSGSPDWINLSDDKKPNIPSRYNSKTTWSSYGNSIILPDPSFSYAISSMKYVINPFMSTGDVSDKQKMAFSADLYNVLRVISSWITKNKDAIVNPPRLFSESPIQASFAIETLLAGVRDFYLNESEKDQIIQTIKSCLGEQQEERFTANTIVSKYDTISKCEKYQKLIKNIPNAKKVVDSMSSGIPDAIYFANVGLNLGRSPLLNNKNVFIVQSPRKAERQIENAFTRALAIHMGSFPLEMKKVYEGMADSFTALVNDKDGNKKKVFLGFNSVRSDPKVYQDVINLANTLQVVPAFPQEVIIVNTTKEAQEHAYHSDVGMITLPNSKACVGEGVLTSESMKLMEELFDKIYIIPKAEWLKFALNSILIDERQGFTGKYERNTPRLAIIPPQTPVFKKALQENHYEVIEQELSYDKGGGFLRCLTLFSNVELGSTEDENTEEEYDNIRRSIDNTMPKDVLETLHWTKKIHQMTKYIYNLKL